MEAGVAVGRGSDMPERRLGGRFDGVDSLFESLGSGGGARGRLAADRRIVERMRLAGIGAALMRCRSGCRRWRGSEAAVRA